MGVKEENIGHMGGQCGITQLLLRPHLSVLLTYCPNFLFFWKHRRLLWSAKYIILFAPVPKRKLQLLISADQSAIQAKPGKSVLVDIPKASVTNCILLPVVNLNNFYQKRYEIKNTAKRSFVSV